MNSDNSLSSSNSSTEVKSEEEQEPPRDQPEYQQNRAARGVCTGQYAKGEPQFDENKFVEQ